uniref:Uncharacterized protein n=1 Tax=Romanomermis culicivorax TaxID=13658 RepID=A0A915IP94_ROMCU
MPNKGKRRQLTHTHSHNNIIIIIYYLSLYYLRNKRKPELSYTGSKAEILQIIRQWQLHASPTKRINCRQQFQALLTSSQYITP